MSAKKQWTGQEKLSIVLQGLRGECSVSALCNEHGITQGMYYKWRDLLLAEGAKIFARGGIDHEKERLQHENRKLKETIGELAIELKKKRVVMRHKKTTKANAKLLMRIQELKSEHPYWCGAPLGSGLVITPDGKWKPCAYINNTLGELTVSSENLIKNWQNWRDNYLAMQRKFCAGCELEFLCMGGCIVSHRNDGSVRFRCALYKSVFFAFLHKYID